MAATDGDDRADNAADHGAVRPRPRPYHHGALRAALIDAAEAELAVSGLEGFTLRGCARRAGVSHAAPAHHFGDVDGLLAAVAALGFDRLRATMREVAEGVTPGTAAHVTAIGHGYIRYALAHPAQFRLLFRREHADRADPTLHAAGDAAFDVLVEAVAALRGVADPLAIPATREEVFGFWGLAHGLADLAISGQLAAGDTGAVAAVAAAILDRFVVAEAARPPGIRPA